MSSSDDQQPCSVSLLRSASGLASISLTVATSGQNCSFNVTSVDAEAESTECRRTGAERPDLQAGGVFTCVLEHLEPGTAYELQVQSQTDNESLNLTLHTRKC